MARTITGIIGSKQIMGLLLMIEELLFIDIILTVIFDFIAFGRIIDILFAQNYFCLSFN